MNNREDYLDSLLKAVIDPKDIAKKAAKKPVNKEDEFLMKYDQELLDLDEENFLQQFEMELGEEEIEDIASRPGEFDELEQFNDLMVDNLDRDDLPDVEYDADLATQLFVEDVVDDISDVEIAAALHESEEGAEHVEQDPKQDDVTKTPGIAEESELLDILAGMTADADLAEIGNMLKAHDDNEMIDGGAEEGLPADLAALFGDSQEDSIPEESGEDSVDALLENARQIGKGDKTEKKEKKEKAEKPVGFFQKLSKLLFGEDEVEVPEAGEVDNISDENMEILRDLEKAEKKKEKKEKKAKKPKEPKKPKPAKPKKPPKPKKPKAPAEKTKPLPKVPVILIFIMGASIVLLVYLGTNLVGYSSVMNQSKSKYDMGKYVEAYQLLQGMEIKEKDQDFFEKARLTAYVQKKLDSYDAYVKRGMYPEALDSLIFAVERYDKYISEATECKVAGEYERMLIIAEEKLTQSFGVTKEEARQLYRLREREEYTKELYQLLERAGLAE